MDGMAGFEIKDGEYTKTIYGMVKEQRWATINNQLALWKINDFYFVQCNNNCQDQTCQSQIYCHNSRNGLVIIEWQPKSVFFLKVQWGHPDPVVHLWLVPHLQGGAVAARLLLLLHSGETGENLCKIGNFVGGTELHPVEGKT